jgi:hypothetical protein
MCLYARVSVTTTPSNKQINSDNYDGGDKELRWALWSVYEANRQPHDQLEKQAERKQKKKEKPQDKITQYNSLT